MNENTTDIRIVKTREKIKDSLITLLKNYKFDEIYVKDICEYAEISRGTFYLHYHDKYDLVLKEQRSVMTHVKMYFKSHNYENKRELIEQAISFWRSDGELILLLSSKGSSEIQQLIKVILQKNIDLNLSPFINNKTISPKDERYFLVFLSNAILGVFQEWVENGKQETSSELTDIICKMTSNVLG